MTKKIVATFIFVFIISVTFRSIRLPETMNFSADQGEFLLDGTKILNGEPYKLIGTRVSSKPIENKYFFTGSQFSYFLAFFQKIFDYDPFKITFIFVLLNSLAVAISFLVAIRYLSFTQSALAAILFATNPLAINYSKIIWNPTILPILFILGVLLIRRPLLVGIIQGLMISTEYGAVLAVPIYLILFFKEDKRNTLKQITVFIIGVTIALSNLIFFDLRHNFYNSTLILKYYLGNDSHSLGIAIHHFIMFFPVIFILLVKTINNKIGRCIFVIAISIQICVFINQTFYSNSGFAMPKNTTYLDLEEAAKLISLDNPKNYNVAQIIDGDSQSHAIRYLLMYRYGPKTDLRETNQYSSSDTIYLIHYRNQNILTGGPYELYSFADKRKIVWNKPLNKYLFLTRLAKT